MNGESNGTCANVVANRHKQHSHADRTDAEAHFLAVHNISLTFPTLCGDRARFRMFFRGLKSDPLP